MRVRNNEANFKWCGTAAWTDAAERQTTRQSAFLLIDLNIQRKNGWKPILQLHPGWKSTSVSRVTFVNWELLMVVKGKGSCQESNDSTHQLSKSCLHVWKRDFFTVHTHFSPATCRHVGVESSPSIMTTAKFWTHFFIYVVFIMTKIITFLMIADGPKQLIWTSRVSLLEFCRSYTTQSWDTSVRSFGRTKPGLFRRWPLGPGCGPNLLRHGSYSLS